MRFDVWAPNATTSVDLLLDDRHIPMSPVENGWWSIEVDAADGARYWYSLDGGKPLADPRARRQPDGPEGASALYDPDTFGWTDVAWRGVSLPGGVLYELHVGTFTSEGTFDGAIKHLDHLVDLGIGIVEVMPIASAPGTSGWGYDGVGLFSVHEPYGGPEALCRFVDACHARGLGVFLDVVYNHLGPSGNHLQEFGPYFTDKYGTPWGAAFNLDDADSDPVREFVIDNAVMWLQRYHVDGLRLDAVHALFDVRAITLLEELSSEINALGARLGRSSWLIAESDRNDPLTVTPREAGGLGLHAQWADDVHHALHVFLTGEDHGYYEDFTDEGALTKVLEGVFFHDGTYSRFRRRTHGRPVDRERTAGWRFVVSLQNHDQVGNRAQGDRLSALVSPGLLACGVALLLTGPGTPMLFMGEEWGASTPWQYFTDHTDPRLAKAVSHGRRHEFKSHGWRARDVPDPQSTSTVERSRLDWDELTAPPHDRLLHWYTDLIRLRRETPDLGDPRLDRISVDHDAAARTVVVHRGAHVVVVNASGAAREVELHADLHDVHDWMGVDSQIIAAWEPRDTRILTSETGVALIQVPPESAAIVRVLDAR
jgi:maltooligosyltrehalose trehalohydrolase